MWAVTPLNYTNKTQNFYPIKGVWTLEQRPFVASAAIEAGTAVAIQVVTSNPTGNLIAAPTTQATGQNIVGILAETIATTDSDYATAGKLKGVWIPIDANCEFTWPVGSGTFTAADVGRTCALVSGGKSVAVDTNGNVCTITKFISSTRLQAKFNMAPIQTA